MRLTELLFVGAVVLIFGWEGLVELFIFVYGGFLLVLGSYYLWYLLRELARARGLWRAGR